MNNENKDEEFFIEEIEETAIEEAVEDAAIEEVTMAAEKKKKKVPRFVKGLLIYVAVFAVMIVALFVVFWKFIGAYEQAMPYNYMEKEFLNFNKDKIDELIDFDNVKVAKEFVSKDYVTEHIKGLITEDLEYIEALENTDKNPVYLLKSGDKNIAKVYFEEDGEGKFGFTKWKLKNYDFTEALPETHSIEITTLAGSKVYLDGVEVPQDYIVEKDIPVKEKEKLEKYMEVTPSYVKYRIEGIVGEKEVKSVDVNGREMPGQVTENSYSFDWANNDTLQSEVGTYVETVNELYAKFFANNGWDLYNYVLKDSYMYENLKLSTTYFYPSEYVSGMKMVSREFSEFRQYSEDCFSCRVKYQFEVYFRGYYTDKEVTNNDMTMIFVKKDGKWLLSDFIYN